MKNDELRTLRVDSNRKILIARNELVNYLARYNGEKDRGLVHTADWTVEMQAVQAMFDKGEL